MFTDELRSSRNAHPVALRPQTRAAAPLVALVVSFRKKKSAVGLFEGGHFINGKVGITFAIHQRSGWWPLLVRERPRGVWQLESTPCVIILPHVA